MGARGIGQKAGRAFHPGGSPGPTWEQSLAPAADGDVNLPDREPQAAQDSSSAAEPGRRLTAAGRAFICAAKAAPRLGIDPGENTDLPRAFRAREDGISS